MKSRAQLAQRRSRRVWWTTRAAVLCPALTVLLAALMVCLGYAAHGGNGDHAAAMTSVSGMQTPTGNPGEHHALPAAHAGDCPSGGTCCAPAVHDVRVILAAPSHPLPVLLPRMPDLPRQPGTTRFFANAPPAGAAPDLHVLQVQRT